MRLLLICFGTHLQVWSWIFTASRSTTISFKEVEIWVSRARLGRICGVAFTSCKLDVRFGLSCGIFGLPEWKIFHFFVQFIHLLFDRFDFFLSFLLVRFLKSPVRRLHDSIFIAHESLQSRCACSLVAESGETIKILVICFRKNNGRWHFGFLSNLISKIEIRIWIILKSWLHNFNDGFWLLFNEPSHALEFAESACFWRWLVGGLRLYHGRKDCSVILILLRNKKRGLLVVVEIGWLVCGVDMDVLRLLIRFGLVIRIHKYCIVKCILNIFILTWEI